MAIPTSPLPARLDPRSSPPPTLTAVTTPEPPTPEELDHDAAIDRGFGRALAIGSLLGIVVFTALIGALTKLMAPTWEASSIAAVAVWTGIWGGLFLGGTITVGLWADKNFH